MALGKKVLNIYNNNKYWLLLLVILFLSATPILLMKKGTCLMSLNHLIEMDLDVIWKIITWLGDGLLLIPLALLILLINKKLGTLLLFNYFISGILAQILKRIIQAPRPVKYYAQNGLDILKTMSVPEATTLSSQLSFPSGHTTSAFAFGVCLILNLKSNALKAFVLFLAIAVGISRMYWRQHFFEDVYTGAILGSITALFIQLAEPKLKARFNA